MVDREVRLGIVGVGNMGRAHVRGLAEVPGVKLVAVCDWDAERAREAAEPSGAMVFTDGAEMIRQADIEALYICVPPHTHEDLEVRAAERGLHLFVEKPVSLFMEQAMQAWQAIRKSGVMTQVGYQLRYFPLYRQLKAFLADKEVGTVHDNYWGGAPNKDWWLRYDQGGGQLVEQATHHVDLLRWVVGEIVAVAASYSFDRLFKYRADTTIPDSQAVLLHFRSGASATMTISCALGKASMSGMNFVLPDARLTVQNDGLRLEPEGAYTLPPLPADTLTADEAFVRAVATGDRSLLLSPYEDGLKTAAVTLAANRSAEEGGRLVRIEEMLPSQ